MLYKKQIILFVKSCLYLAILFTTTIIIHNYNQSENNLFKIEKISIIGNEYIPNQKIINVIEYNLEESIFDFNVKDAKRNIEKNPFINSVQIHLELPNELKIQITERKPIALIINNNQKQFIDYEDNFLPVDNRSINHFPVPVLNIEDISINKNQSVSIIKYLYKDYNKMYHNISEISESHSTITLTTDTRTKIFVNPKMVINNLNKLKKFEESIDLIKKINDYRYIDLKFNNQIVVKEKVYS